MGLFGPPNIEKMKANHDVSGLTKALFYQKDRQVRTDAARVLGELRDVRAVHALIDAIIEANKTRDNIVGREAGAALEKIGTPAVENIIDALKNRSAPVAEVLGNIGDARAVEPLITVLKNGSADARMNAAGALGKFTDPRAVEPLITALMDSESMVGKAAAQALGDLKDTRAVGPLIAILKIWNASVRMAAAGALVNIGPPAMEPLIKALGNKDPQVGRIIVEVLAKLGTPPVDLLVAALKEKNIFAHRDAVSLLNKIGWKPGNDETGAYYWIAANNLKECVRIGAPAFNPLITELPYSIDSASRYALVMALGQIDKPRAVEFFITALKDKVLRFVAVSVLGDWKATEAVEALIPVLKHQDQSMHLTAAVALGNIGDERAVEPLILALNDKDAGDAAAVALGKIGAKMEDTPLRARTVEALIAASTSNNYAMSALGKISDPRAMDPLLAALKGQSSHIRAIAAEALGKFGNVHAVEPLIAALQDKDVRTRKEVIQSLGRLKDPRAVMPLIDLFRKDEPREAIAEALGSIGAQLEDTSLRTRVVELLIAALNEMGHMGLDTPSAAAYALGKIGDARAVKPLIAKLAHDSHNAAAVALVQLYRAGKLDETDKKYIFDHKDKIITPHVDITRDTEGCPGLPPHDDYSAVNFPL